MQFSDPGRVASRHPSPRMPYPSSCSSPKPVPVARDTPLRILKFGPRQLRRIDRQAHWPRFACAAHRSLSPVEDLLARAPTRAEPPHRCQLKPTAPDQVVVRAGRPDLELPVSPPPRAPRNRPLRAVDDTGLRSQVGGPPKLGAVRGS